MSLPLNVLYPLPSQPALVRPCHRPWPLSYRGQSELQPMTPWLRLHLWASALNLEGQGSGGCQIYCYYQGRLTLMERESPNTNFPFSWLEVIPRLFIKSSCSTRGESFELHGVRLVNIVTNNVVWKWEEVEEGDEERSFPNRHHLKNTAFIRLVEWSKSCGYLLSH